MLPTIHTFLIVLTGSGDGPDFSGVSDLVTKYLNIVLIPTFTIIGGFSIFKLISLGHAISQSGDDPEKRRMAIIGIIAWAVGLIICIGAPIFVNTILPTLINNSSGGYKPGT